MRRRALNRLRAALHYRREAFDQGLRAAGFDVVNNLDDPKPGDVLVIWNRYGGFHELALMWERRGAQVIVAENGLLGKSWRSGEWFALAEAHHAGAGRFIVGGDERWDSWGVHLHEWTDGNETVILGQRGIGEPGLASPMQWAESTRGRIGGRIRVHPGTTTVAVPLADDLRHARQVVTWSSGAALSALVLGVPVWYACPSWIGGAAARPLAEWPGEPLRDDAARLRMFRALAWAMWTLDEIRTGEPIARLTATR